MSLQLLSTKAQLDKPSWEQAHTSSNTAWRAWETQEEEQNHTPFLNTVCTKPCTLFLGQPQQELAASRACSLRQEQSDSALHRSPSHPVLPGKAQSIQINSNTLLYHCCCSPHCALPFVYFLPTGQSFPQQSAVGLQQDRPHLQVYFDSATCDLHSRTGRSCRKAPVGKRRNLWRQEPAQA